MEIKFNNQTQVIQEHTTVQFVLNHLVGEKQKGIAVAVNNTVVPKDQWNSYLLQPDDAVLVIKATQGG